MTQEITYSASVSNDPKKLENPNAKMGAALQDLNRNTFTIEIGDSLPNVGHTDIPLSQFGFTENSTWRDAAQALANELNGKTLPPAKGTIHASYDDATGLSINATGLDTIQKTPVYINEKTAPEEGDRYLPPQLVDSRTLDFTGVNLTATEISPFDPDYESLQCFEIKIPDTIPSGPFCISVNGHKQYYYDSSRDGGKFPPDSSYEGSPKSFFLKDTKGMSDAEIK